MKIGEGKGTPLKEATPEHEEELEKASAIIMLLAEIAILHRNLHELEAEVIEYRISIKSLFFRSGINELDSDYRELSKQVSQCTAAIGDVDQIRDFLELDDDYSFSQEEMSLYLDYKEEGRFKRRIDRLQTLSEGIDRRITNKVETMNTRLSLLISTSAALVASVSLLLQYI